MTDEKEDVRNNAAVAFDTMQNGFVERVAQAVLQSIITPGAGTGLITAIYVSLGALFITLAWSAWIGAADIHTGIIAFLALGLLASLTYYFSMLQALQQGALKADPETTKNTSSGIDAQGNVNQTEISQPSQQLRQRTLQQTKASID